MGFAVERVDAAGAEEALQGLELMGRSRYDGLTRSAGRCCSPGTRSRPISSDTADRTTRPGSSPAACPAMIRVCGGWRGTSTVPRPHLKLIADALGHSDPPDILDLRVVEAYWLGSAVLDQVSADRIRPSISAAAVGRFSPTWLRLSPQELCHTTVSSCSASIPGLSMLADPRRTAPAMRVLDRCRIRSGVVLSVAQDQALVESAPLIWDDDRMMVGTP